MRVKLWFSGNPIPKGRPRWSGGVIHTPHATSEWEETVGWQCTDQWKRRPLLGPLGIDFTFYREDRRKVDLDNLEKAMLDALESILYENDSQIKEKSGRLEYSEDHPGVVVEIWTLEGLKEEV